MIAGRRSSIAAREVALAGEPVALAVPHGGPSVVLLDGVGAGLDERGLRAWAREHAAAAGAPHVCRSYRYPYAVVAWHSEPLGIDIERIEPFDGDFMESICTAAECLLPVEEDDPDGYLSALWCSKEALAKALGDALRYDPRRLDSPMFWREGQAGPWRAASLLAPAGHSAWICWRSSANGTAAHAAR